MGRHNTPLFLPPSNFLRHLSFRRWRCCIRHLVLFHPRELGLLYSGATSNAFVRQLYPTLGALIDRYTHALRRLYFALPLLIITSYSILLYARDIVPYWAAWVPAAFSLGSGPLLIVLVIPRLVARHQAPTALGLHKSLEMVRLLAITLRWRSTTDSYLYRPVPSSHNSSPHSYSHEAATSFPQRDQSSNSSALSFSLSSS